MSDFIKKTKINLDNILSKLIKEELETTIDEATYPENFDLDKFKQLKSFKQRVDYCNSTLKKLGSGSSRIVYLVDDKTVLKLAKNQKGIAQNDAEIGASTSYYSDITAEVYESDENGLWLEMELAKPINKARFQEILGYTVEDFGEWLINFWNINHSKPPYYTLDKQIEETINESEFANKVFSFVQDYSLSVGDLGVITSYGEFDGEVKIIDYGLNDDVLNTYYRRMREEMESNENKDMLTETDNESDIKKQIEQLRQEEQDELKLKIPNIEDYKVSGKVDKTLIKNNEDLSIYNEIYNKYDKLISPLLLKLKDDKQVINEVEPSEVPTKTIKYSNQLNPKIWDNETKKLKPIVRYKLLEITKKYLETLKDLDIKFKDIILTGSAANYNYNEQSDLDVHVVVNYDKINQDNTLLLNYFKQIKDNWSNQYKITIHGIPVEMFIQDEKSKEVSSASIYSLLNDKWVIEPTHEKPKYDIETIKKIAADFLTRFDDIKTEYKVNKKDIEKPIADIDKMKADIADLRKKGLDSELGEFSNENLAYKLLRNLLFFDKVNKFKEKLVHDELSLKENRLVITKNKKQGRLITETTVQGKTIINVDIQPEYKNYISFNLNKWVNFINENSNSNSIVFLYNGVDTLGMISESAYQDWLIELGIDENVVFNATFYDKGYAFFRYCMDNSIDEDSVVDLVKYMLKHNINDSREIDEEMWNNYMEESGHTQQEIRGLLEHADDMINIPDLMDFLKNYSNIVLTGGGINECLKEVEIALLSLDKTFNTLSEFVY
jgi:predicted nucleotidyltransferase